MQPKKWTWALGLAYASTAIAAGADRPRIYFPRHVKRQFINATETQQETFPPQTELPIETSAPSSEDDGELSSPPQGPIDVIESIIDDLTDPEPSSSSVEVPVRDTADILTLSIPTTILVSITPEPSVSLPDIIVQPTSSSKAVEEETSSSSSKKDDVVETSSPEPEKTLSSSSSSSSGILLAPTGVVSSEDPKDPKTSQSAESPKPEPETSSSADAEIPSPTDDSAQPNPTAPTTSETPKTQKPVDKEPVETKESSSSDVIVPVIPGPTESSSLPPAETVTPQQPAPTEAPVEQPPTTTEEPLIPTDIIPGIVDPIETALSSVIDGVLPPGGNATTGIEEPTALPTNPPLTDGPIPTDEPQTNVDPQPTDVPSTDVSSSDVPPPPTTTVPTEPPVTDGPASPTDVPDTTVPPPDTTTSDEPIVTTPPGPIANSTTSATEEPLPDITTTLPPPPPPADTATFTSVPIASTVTGKDAWLGTKLAADDATSSINSELPAPTNIEQLPAGMPKTIDASDEVVAQPAGTTLIRIVFDRRLHYEFVAENFTAAQQIFTFLPQIIAYGEGITDSEIRMLRLVPIETKQKKGWITTAAMAYVPTSIIDALQIDIHLTNSALYHHPLPLAYELAQAIDPSFGIFPGSEGEVTNGGSSEEPGGSPFTNGEEDVTEEQTPKQKGATVGIAFGAVSVAVAYGAAMFLVARRYKRKRQAHRRTSSVTDATTDMAFSGPGSSGSPATAMMGGALLSRDFSSYGGVAGGRESHGSGRSGAGNSARTAYISAPVAAENSLGWN